MHSVSSLIQNPQAVAVWFDALLKSFVVLGFAGGVCVVSRRASAATRHLIWFLALASLPLLPLLPRVLPAARRPLWSISSERMSGNQIALSLELTPTTSSANSVPIQAQSPGKAVAVKSARRLFKAQLDPNWLAIAFVTWAGGIAFMLLYSALGWFQLRRIWRKAGLLDTAEWARLLAEACETLHLSRRVVLLQSTENIMPLTWGWLRPKVLMPLEAEQWSAERRRIVLLHELAHVKRLDCLTQTIARIIAALYWFNLLAWMAVRQMRIERERACDDLVLNGGCKASDYAGHLVQIAKSFRRAPQMAGIAMARSSNLEQRVTAIVDASRARRLRPLGLAGVLISTLAVLFCIGGYKTSLAKADDSSLRQQQIARLEEFSRQKLEQSKILAASSGETISPEFQRLFDAATTGDWQTVTNMFESFKQRHPQYNRRKGVPMDIRLRTSYWSPVLEIDLAYDHVVNCDPKYTEMAVDGIVNSIPAGAIYFGGTDPGRGLPTAFSKSQINAEPFYTLTQNALADGTYLEYLRNTYGERRHWLGPLTEARRADSELQAWDREFQNALENEASLMSRYPENDPKCEAGDKATDELRDKRDKRTDEILTRLQKTMTAQKKAQLLSEPPQSIYIPTKEDSENCFQEYSQDAAQRMEKHQLKPGEEVSKDAKGHIQVRGQVSVMSINGLIAKVVFDKNPNREFYVEESFPLDWMFPHLEPHGLIMKINREPLAQLSEEVVQRDHDYWQKLVSGMIGNWLTDDTPVQTVTEFAERVYLRKDMTGFTGDPQFVQDNYAPKMFSKWRSFIGGVYGWRLGVAPSGGTTPAQYVARDKAEQTRMIKEADFAYKQAFALCPGSPEAVFRYAQFLVNQKRRSDALLIAQTASRLDPANDQLKSLIRNLNQMH